LTNPDETSQADSRRLRSIRSSARCVTITPRSQWTFLWQENDVAMMSYSGTVGRPGSYYLRVDDLVDANGQHPGESAAAPEPSGPPPSTAAPGVTAEKTASTPPVAPSPEVSEAPLASPRTPPPAAPGTSIDTIIANANGTPPSAVPPQKSPAGAETDMPVRIWGLAAVLAFVAALGGFLVLRRRRGRSGKYAPALEIALDEIHAQASALRAAKSDSMQPDRYGTLHPDGWEREKAMFAHSRLSARLHEAGYLDMLPALMPAVDMEIERQTNAAFEASPVAAAAGSYHTDYAAETDEIDPDLSTYVTRCTSLLENAGWKTEPGTTGTARGIDILAERDGRKLLLQCKGGGTPVGVEAVQRVFALKDRGRLDIAAIVSHAPFTRAAQQMASANGVHALHDDGLMQLIQ
jgi:restriction system protein